MWHQLNARKILFFQESKRRLLQLNEESDPTLVVPSSIEDLHSHIEAAKVEAIEDAKKCSMSLSNYDDSTLMMENVSTI